MKVILGEGPVVEVKRYESDRAVTTKKVKTMILSCEECGHRSKSYSKPNVLSKALLRPCRACAGIARDETTKKALEARQRRLESNFKATDGYEWFPIPGTAGYEASTEGLIRNAKTGKLRSIRRSGSARRNCCTLTLADGRPASAILARLVLAAKLGRRIESWEQACHGPGGPLDDSMDNLSVGCALNNALDCIEAGKRGTSREELERAAKRIAVLLEKIK